MIYGIGVDILELQRVMEMSRKMGWALAHQVLGPREIETYSELLDDKRLAVNYLARRFSAKEAFVKASRLQNLDVREVQILNHESGEPYIALCGMPLLQMGGLDWQHHVSISDSDESVVACVICERVR